MDRPFGARARRVHLRQPAAFRIRRTRPPKPVPSRRRCWPSQAGAMSGCTLPTQESGFRIAPPSGKRDSDVVHSNRRDVAQPGRALGLGPRSRRFKSCRPDHFCRGKQRSRRSQPVVPPVVPGTHTGPAWRAARGAGGSLFRVPTVESYGPSLSLVHAPTLGPDNRRRGQPVPGRASQIREIRSVPAPAAGCPGQLRQGPRSGADQSGRGRPGGGMAGFIVVERPHPEGLPGGHPDLARLVSASRMDPGQPGRGRGSPRSEAAQSPARA